PIRFGTELPFQLADAFLQGSPHFGFILCLGLGIGAGLRFVASLGLGVGPRFGLVASLGLGIACFGFGIRTGLCFVACLGLGVGAGLRFAASLGLGLFLRDRGRCQVRQLLCCGRVVEPGSISLQPEEHTHRR